MDPVRFAGDRLVIHFFSYPRMWVSQGNPQKLKYCPWLRYPLFGPTLLSLTVQFKSYWWSSWPALCLKKPSELTLWPALIVLLRIVREQARVFTVSDKALQDRSATYFPPPLHGGPVTVCGTPKPRLQPLDSCECTGEKERSNVLLALKVEQVGTGRVIIRNILY